MENEKWYAVQETSEDAWDYGSSDFEEAKAMLKKQGHGLIAVIDKGDFCEDEIQFEDLFDIEDFDNEELAKYVKNAEAWDEIGVQERMEILAHRANIALWELYKNDVDDDQVMTAADDILSWINFEDDEADLDEKVWKAGEVLEDLAKENSPYDSPYKSVSGNFEGWASIAKYIQCLLDVDLGI